MFPKPTIVDAWEVNKIVARLKAVVAALRIHPFKEELIRRVLISDSSFDTIGKTEPQHCWIQGIVTQEVNRGEQAPVSLIAWKTRLFELVGKYFAGYCFRRLQKPPQFQL